MPLLWISMQQVAATKQSMWLRIVHSGD